MAETVRITDGPAHVVFNAHRIIGGRRYFCVLVGNPDAPETATILQAIPDDAPVSQPAEERV